MKILICSLVTTCYLALPSLAFAWPTGPPTSIFPTTAGTTTVLCGEWKSTGGFVLDCPRLGTAQLSWPPAGARPSRTWGMTAYGSLYRCRQWNGYSPKTSAYVGFVAVCDPAQPSGPVA